MVEMIIETSQKQKPSKKINKSDISSIYIFPYYQTDSLIATTNGGSWFDD